eukprot:1156777-Pelagomonas_calceolata.AAC.4
MIACSFQSKAVGANPPACPLPHRHLPTLLLLTVTFPYFHILLVPNSMLQLQHNSQALLDTSMTDPAGLLPATPSSSSSAPAASGQPTTTSSTTNNQGITTTTTTTTSSSSASTSSSAPASQAPGATRAAGTMRARAGGATPASARSNMVSPEHVSVSRHALWRNACMR